MKKIEISYRTIVFTFGFMGLLWFLYQIKGVLFLLFLAIILMSILRPGVVWLENKKVPRVWAILTIYLLLLVTVGSILAVIITPLAVQTGSLLSRLPEIFSRLNVFQLEVSNLGFIGSEMIKLPQQVIRLVSSATANLLYLFTLLVMTYYLLLEREHLTNYLSVLFGDGDGQKKAQAVVGEIERVLGGWARGQLILMLIIAVMSYVGLSLLGVPSAIPLALLAGLLEFITNIGPTLALVPAAIVGFSISPLMGVTVIVLYLLIQQVENNLLVPKIMRQAVGLNPLITITLILSGYKVAGAAGTILAVPLFLTLKILLSELYRVRAAK
ncbi:AI-2E family transporter [Patescibacteria group bacterium]|nr:AI-2E family transporter [Patescibacteria group bacterium]MBU1931424.1 AI-2E family transporter [Patescibacteria group bacterium]